MPSQQRQEHVFEAQRKDVFEVSEIKEYGFSSEFLKLSESYDLDGEKADRKFCLAIPKNQHQPLFFAAMDEKNSFGDSCVGIYADRDFYFEIPAENFEWGPVSDSEFPVMEYLMENYHFDTRWIPNITHCDWMKTQVTLTLPQD